MRFRVPKGSIHFPVSPSGSGSPSCSISRPATGWNSSSSGTARPTSPSTAAGSSRRWKGRRGSCSGTCTGRRRRPGSAGPTPLATVRASSTRRFWARRSWPERPRRRDVGAHARGLARLPDPRRGPHRALGVQRRWLRGGDPHPHAHRPGRNADAGVRRHHRCRGSVAAGSLHSIPSTGARFLRVLVRTRSNRGVVL